MRNRSPKCVAVLPSLLMGCFIGLSTTPLWAQATSAVNGTVRDSAGAVVTDATIMLHNRDTGVDRTALTNGVGEYVMTNVQPGDYDLRVARPVSRPRSSRASRW